MTVIENGATRIEPPKPASDPLRRLISRVGPIRALVKSSAGQRAIESIRAARAVHAPLRFLARQLGPSRPARYRLRRSGQTAVIRHHSRDVEVLNEIFGGTGGRLAYEPPPDLGEMLDAIPSPRILDLGGNVGLFGLYALHRWPSASLHSFEPDHENARLMSAVIAENGLQERWSLTSSAVADHAGTMAFRAGLTADSHLVALDAQELAEGDVQVPVVDLFAIDGRHDIVKMDIEGGEWGVLVDPRMADLATDIIVLEWHTQGCPAPDPRAHVIDLLRKAGFTELHEPLEPSHCGMFWARRAAVREPAVA